MPETDRLGPALAELLRRTHLMHPGDLPVHVDETAGMLGVGSCNVYLITRDQQTLVPLSPKVEGPLGLEGTLAGRCYRTTEITRTSDGARCWVPLLDGTERVGVLEVLGTDEEPLDGLTDALVAFAALVAELVVSKSQYSDTFERTRRGVPMGVAAELLWRQLPPLTFATRQFVVTAQLEPWHEVGGDAFDYSIDGDVLRLAVFDAMGHGLGATLLAGVALAAYRNARRSGQGLVEIAATIDEELAGQFGIESFVTGVLAQLDVTTGVLQLLCAAHPAPVLVRDGKAVGELRLEPGVPFGLGNRDDVVTQVGLQAGDRVLAFSDGVVEARSPEGQFFGTERLIDLLTREESRAQPPPETLRRLIVAVLEHQQGMLQDDATLLMLEWAGNTVELQPS